MANMAYKMAIVNIANHIKNFEYDHSNSSGGPSAIDASYYLSIAFCKAKEEIFSDIIFCHEQL